MGENRLSFLLVSTCLFTNPKILALMRNTCFTTPSGFFCFLKLLEFDFFFFVTKNIDRRTVSLMSFLTTSMTKTGPL